MVSTPSFSTPAAISARTERTSSRPCGPAGKQALFDYVKAGGGFIGLHSSSDSFHTNNESQKGPDRYANHGKDADPYVCFLGGEFIIHGAQQMATNKVIDPAFPGFTKAGDSFALHEEWYSLKDFREDIHVAAATPPNLATAAMTNPKYQAPSQRPAAPKKQKPAK